MEKRSHSLLSKLATGFMRLFFRLLYHSFAWAYDLVAGVVSLGRWKEWVKSAAGLLAGPRVLELGFGPGHMQAYLADAGLFPFGLDESCQMARQARRRLLGRGQSPRLARGLAQALPFAEESFDSILATFPTQYITDPATLREIRRVLRPSPLPGTSAGAGGHPPAPTGAQLVVLMTAWITGRSLPDHLMRWVFRVTGESPQEDLDLAEVLEPYRQGGFRASIRFIDLPGSRLMAVVAIKEETLTV